MIGVSLVDLSFIKKHAYLFYLIGIILLICATFFGIVGKGSRRWLNIGGLVFQPSELIKILVIITLAKFFDEKKIQNGKDYIFLILPIFLILSPFFLILIQPDLGTAMIVLLLGLIIFFISGISWKFFSILSLFFLVSTPYIWGSLKEYQQKRILTLFNPENDPLGSGYHIIQSQIAVGSGGIFGKGWTKGSQSHLDFLPEKHTDFIFSMLGEEFGFLGTISVIGLICLITYLTYSIASKSFSDNFNKMIGYGIISNYFFVSMINMSMVIGILPVVGLPLPLVSYGGSSMISYFIGFGIILSIDRSKRN
jgi:rod shape determining protein RodA